MTSKEEIDTYKDEYLFPTPDREIDQKIFELISEFVISRLTGVRILELGVGDQIWTPKLLNKFRDVTSVDASEGLLTAMQRKVGEKNWTPVLSIFEEYQPTQPFDTVLMTYVLEHVDEPFLLLKLARDKWLKNSGRLAVVVPNALSLHRRLAVKMGLASSCTELGETDRRMGHKRVFTCYEMERMIVDAGFKIVEQYGMFTKVLPNSLLTQCSDEQLLGLFKLGLELPIEYASAVYFLAEKKPL